MFVTSKERLKLSLHVAKDVRKSQQILDARVLQPGTLQEQEVVSRSRCHESNSVNG